MGNKDKNTEMEPEVSGQTENMTADTAETSDNQADNATESSELANIQAQVMEQKDKYIRLLAEFENYKKRVSKEKLDWIQNASKDTMSALLPVLDDFDRAIKSAEAQGETFPEGILLIYNKFYNTLHSRGLKPMESNGLPFDPEWHEAITEIPAPDETMKGKVIDTVETGYLLNEKIIRYAKVVVGK